MQYAVSELRGLLDTMELIEELIHAYEILDRNQLNYSENGYPSELMDKYMKSQSSMRIYQYFNEHLDELSHNEQIKIKKIDEYYLKDKYAHKYFNQDFKVVQKELKEKWLESLNPKLLEQSLEQDLDRIRLFYASYYAEKFHLFAPKYEEILSCLYGDDFVCSCCKQLNNHHEKIIQFYKSYLLSNNIPTNADVCDLIITQEQATYFFNYFLNQIHSLIKPYKITVEFKRKAKCLNLNHKFYIHLSSYHSFSISLFEFLELFGEAYAKILQSRVENEWLEEQQNYRINACRYYATLIPILTIDFSRLLESYFYNIDSVEEVYHTLLNNFLAIRRNPVSSSNINFFQLFLIDMIGYELEEKWFNGEITSRELINSWQEFIKEYFGQTSFNVYEIVLKIFQSLLEDLGISLLRIGIVLSAFEHGMLNDQYDHPFKTLIEDYRNHLLDRWSPAEDFLRPHSIKEEALQYFILYFIHLYKKV